MLQQEVSLISSFRCGLTYYEFQLHLVINKKVKALPEVTEGCAWRSLLAKQRLGANCIYVGCCQICFFIEPGVQLSQ